MKKIIKRILKRINEQKYSPRDIYDKNYFKTLLEREIILSRRGYLR